MCTPCHIGEAVYARIVTRDQRARDHQDGDYRCIRGGTCVDCDERVPGPYDRQLPPNRGLERPFAIVDHMCMNVLRKQIVGPSRGFHRTTSYLEVRR